MSELSPRELALASHRDYYAAGGFDSDRLNWTLDTFLSSEKQEKVLEVGCGDGAMLRLLKERRFDAVGVDASSSGIDRCLASGLAAHCLDISSDRLPFADDCFDVVISLETFEHLMNPYYALQEVRRTLRSCGRLICSVPNPLTGHPYLYPGLFEYKNFRRFLEQSGFSILRVDHWQWAPHSMILPRPLRTVPVVSSRIVAGGLRRIIERTFRFLGAFPSFCYWLWTFECLNTKSADAAPFEQISERTRPGSVPHFCQAK